MLDEDEGLVINDRMVTPDYLAGLGASLVRGRWLTDLDQAGGEPVVVVNQSLAAQLWQNDDPVGRCLRNQRSGPDAQWHTEVGVVTDVFEAEEGAFSWYRPYAQHAADRDASPLTIWARRSTGAPEPLRFRLSGPRSLETTTAEALLRMYSTGNDKARCSEAPLASSVYSSPPLRLWVDLLHGVPPDARVRNPPGVGQ